MSDYQSSGASSEEDDELELLALAVAGMVVIGAEEARIHRAEQRLPSRRYLRRPQLLPSPRANTPWQVLYDSRDDRAYITTMGIDCATFDYILQNGFAEEWDSSPIPRPDTNQNGNPRLGRRSLTAEGALGLTFHYLTSTMSDTALQQIFALIPTTVSRYRAFGLKILLKTLRHLPEATVEWWRTEEECEDDNSLILARHPLLEGAIGSIDGLNLPLATSDDPDLENATYNGWLHGHFTSCVIVFSPKGVAKSCILNAPGSWHDAKIARSIYRKLENDTPEGYYLVADTAFPRGTRSIAGRIRAPLKSGQRLPQEAGEREALLSHNRQLLSYRQTAEWGMRTLQSSFSRLRMPLDVNDPVGRGELLETCIRSMNLRAVRVGISQIRTVYMRCWKDAEDEDIWNDFENVLFGDLRRRDRVSRFHRIVVEE